MESIFEEKVPTRNFKETRVYKLAYEQAMDIFETTKNFPKEETYSLTDQIRKASRSVCANLAEAYRKKRYQAHFVSKASDSDTENLKQMYGSIFLLRVNTFQKKRTKHGLKEMGKLESY